MKLILAVLVLFSGFSEFANARQPKATLYADLAKNTVVSLYGRAGDQVSLELVDMLHGDENRETWTVNLSNGAQTGSASYEVEIIAKETGVDEGAEAASIKVKYLSGT